MERFTRCSGHRVISPGQSARQKISYFLSRRRDTSPTCSACETLKFLWQTSFASGILKLGGKLGPILWQLPPNFKYSSELIESFLALLPRNTEEAVELGKKHDQMVEGRTFLETDRNRPIRHALEIRHPSFVAPEFIAILRKYKVALVCADTVEWPRLMDVTSDFVYCRLHGSKVLYSSGYSKAAIEEWAVRVAAWAKGGESHLCDYASTKKLAKRAKRDVFVYFDNDMKVRAPRDAKRLQARIEELLA